jgi:hypothetical protein
MEDIIQKKDSIKIDEKTKQILLDHKRALDELSTRYNLILQTYLNAHGVIDGQYNITDDFEFLVKAPDRGIKSTPKPK